MSQIIKLQGKPNSSGNSSLLIVMSATRIVYAEKMDNQRESRRNRRNSLEPKEDEKASKAKKQAQNEACGEEALL